mgnify:FL=1|tara:strand:+ start:2965 stop:3645 length:681 start_codon:yes stop_codon:yes gene_type:complete
MSEEQQVDTTEQLVRDFLLKNPTFLDKNPDILEGLTLPHNAGSAVSLVERQVGVMRDRNKDMRKRLENILETAHNNELLFEKTKRLTLKLLEAESLPSLVETVYESLGKDYAIDFYSLTLLGEETKLPATMARIASVEKANKTVGALLESNRPVCGVLRQDEMAFLFGEKGAQVGSVAMVPLKFNHLSGILAVGNSDPNFYSSSMGTLFLSYIADVLNRVLPKHLK